jgi:hypothetical protein
MADFVWTNFLKPYRRVDGKVVKGADTIAADVGAVALAVGASKAYVNNTLVPIAGAKGEATVASLNGDLYVPAQFLEIAFPGTKVDFSDGGQTATIRFKGHTAQVSRGNWVMVRDNTLQYIKRPQFTGGNLLVPVQDLAYLLYGFRSYVRDGAAYLVDHDAVLTYDLAYTIKTILGVQKEPSYRECLSIYVKYTELQKAEQASG